MPIGSTNVYYPGDLILSTVSSSGTSFIETKIVASTSSIIYFDNNARINSASLSSFTFGSSSYSLTSSYSVYAETASNAQNAQDILVYVKNTSGAIITKGSLVRIKDVENSGFNPTIELASFTNESGSANTLGYAYQQFAINDLGYVITEGKLTGVNTGNFSPGDLLYLSSSGQYTNVKPIPPNHGVRVGQVIRAHPTVGSIYVTIDNGAELDELHNVIDNSTTSSYGDLLTKSGSVWINSKNLTGSYTLSGSLTTNGAISALNVTASLLGTASWANNSTSASYALTASYVNISSSNVFLQGGNSFGTTALLGTNDAQPLIFETSGSERMRILSGGNIGIGTSVASELLDVYRANAGVGWNPRIVARDGTNAAFIGVYNGQPGVFAHNNALNAWADLYLNTSDPTNSIVSGKVFIGGNVGIGTTSPTALLDVSYGDYQNAGTLRLGADIGVNRSRTNNSRKYGSITGFPYNNFSASIQAIGIDALNSTTTGLTIGGGSVSFASPTQIQFYTTSSTTAPGAERMRIDSGGNVGIGTTSPATVLNVSGSTRISAGELQLEGDNAAIRLYRTTGINYLDWASGQNFYLGTVTSIGGAGRTNKMVILDNGNVGIGTTVPGAILDLWSAASRIKFRRTSSYDMSFGMHDSVTSALSIKNSSDASTVAFFQFDGNVGIGTTNPGSRLEVQFPTNPATDNGAGNNVLRIWTSASFASDVGGAIGLGGTYNTSSYQSFGQIAGRKSNSTSGNNAGYLQFATTNNSGTMTEWMRIDAIGNVGIGTTSPSSKLSVSGSIESLTGDGGEGGQLVLRGNTYRYNVDNFNGQALRLFREDDATSANGVVLMYISGSGNVGINTSTPSYKLDVNGNANFTNGFYTNTDASSTSYFVGANGTRPIIFQNNTGASYDFGFKFFDSNTLTIVGGNTLANPTTDLISFTYDGKVGIGTTSPVYLLDVSGSSRHGFTASNTHLFTGSVSVSNNVTCLSLTETSTEAVKYNIVPLPSQLENVLKLTPVSFNYKTNNKHSIGLIAEEVAKVYPEFTSENNDSISYGKITSVLIQSIKELKSIIDTQQKQIEELSNKFKQL